MRATRIDWWRLAIASRNDDSETLGDEDEEKREEHGFRRHRRVWSFRMSRPAVGAYRNGACRAKGRRGRVPIEAAEGASRSRFAINYRR